MNQNNAKKVVKKKDKDVKSEKDFSVLENELGVNFNNKNLLIQAFIHRSYINESEGIKLGHNERLEFLGDAVLELASTNYLYHKFKDLAEGELTAYRAALVNTKSISAVAKDLGFNDYLFLSRGESKDFGKARLSILADTYESFIGAIFLDKGYDFAKEFIENTLLIHTDRIIEEGKYKDPKSTVQEKSQEILSVTPSYRVVSESGPDHDKKFIIAIYFGEDRIADGEGKSKQEAETDAAKNALIKKAGINKDSINMDSRENINSKKEQLQKLKSVLDRVKSFLNKYSDPKVLKEGDDKYLVNEKEKQEILNDLRLVGENKALGYLPISTIKKYSDIDLNKIKEELESKGMVVIELNEEESNVTGGALYAYDRDSLKHILESGKSILEKNKWPIDPDAFVRHLNIYTEDEDLYNLIMKVFADPRLKQK